jgi:hypothetical protein
MRWIAMAGVLLAAGVCQAQAPVNYAPMIPPATPALPTPDMSYPYAGPVIGPSYAPADGGGRGFLESDRAFDDFIGPISNPVLTKDPRSLTEARALFVENWFPEGNSVLRGGDVQIYGLQVRAALTERLSFVADKDGYASLSAKGLPHQTGWLNINAGLKYLLIRDVENQTLWSVGATYEPPTGEAKVFQGNHSGFVTAFTTFGQQIDYWHLLLNGGYQTGITDRQSSSFFYSQIHVDRQLFGWLYPLAEFNFFGYNSGGQNLPAALGEFDGLINFGTQGQAGRTFVTFALGLKAKVNCHLDVGVAWDTPLGDKNVMLQRVLAEMIFRY